MIIATDSWVPSKIKYLARYINGYPFKPTEWSDRGRPIIRIQNLSNRDANSNYFEGEIPEIYLVHEGDLLLSWSATLGAFEWSGPDAWLNQHIFKVELNTRLIKKAFFKWLAEWFMNELNAEAHGSTMQHLTKDRFGGFKVLIPPDDLQVRISNYLDRETIHIDALVAEKERMLALLEEKRDALIIRAVTRGINSTTPFKHSGLDWLGELPSHWKLKRAKGLFFEIDSRTKTGEEVLLSLRMSKGLIPHNDVSEKVLDSSDLIGFKKVKVGQMVINRMRAASGLIAVADQPGLVSPDYAVFDILDRDMSIEYFLELFKTFMLQAVFRSVSKGLGTGEQGFLRLYSDNFLALHFPYPPKEEQRAIVEFINKERLEMEAMVEALLHSIELAKERRVALIAGAVKGEIILEETAK